MGEEHEVAPGEDEVEEEETEDPVEEEETESLEELIAGMESRLADRLEEKLGSRFDAVADRRVNAILEEMRKAPGAKAKDDETPTVVVNGTADRTRRALLKSAIQNEVLMSTLSKDEQKMAQSLAFEMAEHRSLGDDDDEFAIAAAIVERATEVLTSAKGVYQGKLRDELKSRGVELEDTEPGQKKKTTKNRGGELQSAFDKGAQLAASRGLASTTEEKA